MPKVVVVTEAVVRRAYEVDADGPEAARAIFGPDAEKRTVVGVRFSCPCCDCDSLSPLGILASRFPR